MTYKLIKRDGKTIDFCHANTPTPEDCEALVVEEVDCHEVEPMLTEICESLGISFKCEFVPYSKSRNKDENYHSLNWQCTLQKLGRDIYTFSYSKGNGHCYAAKNPDKFVVKFKSGQVDKWSTHQAQAQAKVEECEAGQYPLKAHSSERHKTPAPSSGELLSSLLRDVQCVAYKTFEDFCDELGYDSDSRKTEGIYNECVRAERQLRCVLFGSRFDRLTELANFN